ncbi:hypothetical protein TcasGA2_TC011152 [Tribolium castaneum]|uniref:Uncharacterized protein n=1 Tax=Tribolium castaneum TaxID=7070 RepID=D6X410_TRICA|nr:hypothetical protein TcasGA2_TC011152 [Tribolium castaneum]
MPRAATVAFYRRIHTTRETILSSRKHHNSQPNPPPPVPRNEIIRHCIGKNPVIIADFLPKFHFRGPFGAERKLEVNKLRENVVLCTCHNTRTLVQTQFQGLLNMQTHPSRSCGRMCSIFGSFRDSTINIRAR